MTRSTTALLLVLAFTAAALGLATVSRGNIDFAIDTAVFSIRAGAGDTLLLEVYQEVDIAQFSRGSDGMCLFTTEISLCSVPGDTVAADIWNTPLAWSESGRAVNCTLLPVLEGDWILTVSMTDAGNGRQGVAVRELSVEHPEHLSDVEIARTIMPAVEGSVNSLLKGSIIVFPAASTRFAVPGESMLYTYQEIYSLGGTDILRYSKLLNPEGLPIFARPADVISIPDGMETIALIDSIDLSVVREPGLYTLSVTYTQNGDTLGSVFKPLVVEVFLPVVESVQTPEIFSTGCLIEFPLLLNREEAELFNRLDEDGKALYYNNYWNANPGEHNGYLERSRVVAARFSALGKEGWETDRGRVYLIFGEPDEVESDPFSTTQAPYELWTYYSSEQEGFVFADLMGNGDYLQIYSTVEGEVSYSNWQSMLQNVNRSGGSSGGDDEF
ncbi:MAG: GWxTD domain-containing protein [Candidatus Sabulitectum sp.]|nr:GWxTD domain-containing protein [Candidatus Sabulitectum sp.]